MKRIFASLVLIVWVSTGSGWSRIPERTLRPGLDRAGYLKNRNHPGKDYLKRHSDYVRPDNQPYPSVSCNTGIIDLTPGVSYMGTTIGAVNDFYNNPPLREDYPGLTWGETGPDVVHRIVLTQTADLRILVEPDPVTLPDLDVILIQDSGGCDTSNWIYAGDWVIVYPDAPPGTYYIIVDGYTNTDEGSYTLTAATAAGILVVDDDGSGDPTQCGGTCPDIALDYINALDSLVPKPSYSLWNVATSGSPDAVTLNNSQIVFWLNGATYDSGMTVTATDQERLMKYLDLGGRLYMEGQDILWDIMSGQDGYLPDGGLFNDYLQVSYVYQDTFTPTSSPFTLQGVLGDPIADLLNCNDASYAFDIDTSKMNPYVDSLLTRYGTPVYYNPYRAGDTETQKPAGVRYAASLGISDYFKTVFFAFSPPSNRASDRQARLNTLVANLVAWLDKDDSTLCQGNDSVSGFFDDSGVGGNNNGIPDPNETFTFKVQVTNNGSTTRNYRVYNGFQDFYTTRYTPYCVDLGNIPPGASGTASFSLKILSSTPIGYSLEPGFNIESTSDFCWRTEFGAFVGQADVLLVKDEMLFPNTTAVDEYLRILKLIPDPLGTGNLTVAMWDASRFDSPSYNSVGLSNDRMINYPFVVWFTGYDFYCTLIPNTALGCHTAINPETELTSYLTNRYTDKGDYARLILSSQDYLWEKYAGVSQDIPPTDFAYTQLKIRHVDQDVVKDATSMWNGTDGTYVAEKMSMALTNQQVFRNYADVVFAESSEAGTQEFCSYASPGQVAGVMNLRKNRTSRFLFMPFAPENLQDGTPDGFPSKKRFFERTLCTMGMGPSSIIPPCGYYPPAGAPGVTLMVSKDPSRKAVLTWTTSSFTNTAGEPIFGLYRVRRSTVTTTCPNPGSSPYGIATTTALTSWTDPDSGAPGQLSCYHLIDYEDDFAQSAALGPP